MEYAAPSPRGFSLPCCWWRWCPWPSPITPTLPLLLDGVEAQRARQAQGRLQTAALRLGEMAGRLTARMNAVAESPALGEGAFSPAGEEALYQALFSLLEPVYEEGRFYLYSQDGGVYAVNGGAQAPEFTPDWGVFRAAAQQPGETIFLPADGVGPVRRADGGDGLSSGAGGRGTAGRAAAGLLR